MPQRSNWILFFLFKNLAQTDPEVFSLNRVCGPGTMDLAHPYIHSYRESTHEVNP